MSTENDRVHTLAKLTFRFFHLLEEVEDLRNVVCTSCYGRRKTTSKVNQQSANHTQSNERLEKVPWRKTSTLEKVQRRASKCALGNIGRKTRPSKPLKNDQHFNKEVYFRLCRTINRPTDQILQLFQVCTLFSVLNSESSP